MGYKVAGIDIHKKVLMVVVMLVQAGGLVEKIERRRLGTTTPELAQLAAWLQALGVQEAVMESTAQYWKPVWGELEGKIPTLHLAQAFSNRARRGRKDDFRDAERLLRRLVAGELVLSFVPPPEQRNLRTMTRMQVHLTYDRGRLHNQVECLLEEMRIKLSSVLSDLFGVTGLRILGALAEGETDPQKLAALAEHRLKCTSQQLLAALTGKVQPMHQRLLGLYLKRLKLIDQQINELKHMIAEALEAHQETVQRLAEVPGFGADSAQQIIAEVGPEAATFPSAGEMASWVGTCPGQNESAEENHSSRSAKGNRYARRLLTEAANAAVKTKGSHWQVVFRRLLPRLGYQQAVWAVTHRLCRVVWKILHDKVRYVEQGLQRDPKARANRARTLARALRQLGYKVELTPPSPALAQTSP
jgi:transposase